MIGTKRILRLCIRAVGVLLLAAVIGLTTNALNPDGIPLTKSSITVSQPRTSSPPIIEQPTTHQKELDNETLHIEFITDSNEGDPQG